MSKAYSETYRGIGFHRTDKGYWFFDEVPQAGRYRYWSDYLLPDEQQDLKKDTMRLAIDRYKASV